MSKASTVFEDLTELRIGLSRALDLRLRTEHDLPLEMFEIMAAIAAGECDLAGIACHAGTEDEPAASLILRIEARGLCLTIQGADQLTVRGLTLAGSYLFEHASAVFEDELSGLMGAASLRTPMSIVDDMLALIMSSDPSDRQQST